MKARFVKWYNALLSSLITLLGFSACDALNPKDEYGAPYVEYGSPSVSYRVKGRVTDAEGKPLSGIKAEAGSAWDGHFYPSAEPTMTDAEGNVELKAHAGTLHGQVLVLSDVDGEEGGGDFGSDTISVESLPHKATAEGTWHSEYEVEANIQLKAKQ